MSARSWTETTETAWQVPLPEPAIAEALAAELGISPLLGQILLNRGIRHADEARSFLSPSMNDLAEPAELPGMARAVERVLAAVRDREPIVVYGDYDVDGISGTALLTGFLELAGATVRPRLPNRLSEGYGLNEAAVRTLVEEETGLLVTVDHGTTANAEIDLARDLGLDVVVLDHHTPGESLPDAVAIVNPHLAGDGGAYPCGAGVAFKLAWALATGLAGGPRVAEVHREYLTDSLALVALGTIADVVSLRDENRIYGRFGLEVLSKTKRPGLRALLRLARVDTTVPSASDVGFRLAPRLNAAGRMGEAELALELLMTDSKERGRTIAARLDQENNRRREIEAAILAEVRERVEAEYPPGHPGAFVVGSPEWHAGVIGIVAARLVDLYHRPAVVVAFEGGIGRGSCRTIPAVPLPEVLAKCEEHLVGWGGHAAAAGFTVDEARFEDFRAAFDGIVRGMLGPEDLVRRIRVDLTTELGRVTPALVRDMERLAPFGEGNPRPVLGTRGVRVAGRPRRVGRTGEHLSFLASDGTQSLRAIAFRRGPMAEEMGAGRTVDIAYKPRFDDWRADGSLQLTIEDLTICDG